MGPIWTLIDQIGIIVGLALFIVELVKWVFIWQISEDVEDIQEDVEDIQEDYHRTAR